MLSMRIGKNIGNLLLELAQENIIKGEPEKAVSLYSECLSGFTKEYSIAVLQNKYVLCIDEENQELYLSDNPDLIIKNFKDNHFYDWNKVLFNLNNDIEETQQYCQILSDEFSRIVKNASIYDFNILEYGKKVNAVNISHLCARVLAGNPFANCHSSGEKRWQNIVDKYYSGILDEKLMPFVIVAEYVKQIADLCFILVKYCKIYEFLYENKMCERIPYFEYKITNIIKYIDSFTDTGVGYYHPMCNVEIYNLKENLVDKILSTKIGSEYLKYGVVSVTFEDRFDAGWLTPDGQFYADNGPVHNMIHFCIAKNILEHTANPISAEMREAGVSLFSINSPERFLEHKGWIKIHNNEVYGYFSVDIDDWLDEPTTEQIDFIYNYIKSHYNGMFYNESQFLNKTEPISVIQLRQMDKFALRKIFNL